MKINKNHGSDNMGKILPPLRFPEFKEEWKIDKLGKLAKNFSTKRIPITSIKREKGDIPYYGATGVIDYVKDFIFDEELLLISEDGANLLDRNYPIAYSISGKTWVNNHAHVLKFKYKSTEILVEKYINSNSVEEYLTGKAQPKLNKNNLERIIIPLPQNPKEQQKIAACLSSLDEVITAETEILDLLQDHKKGLLQQLFPAEGESQPKFRFPEFKEDGDWEETVLSDICNITNGKSNAQDHIEDGEFPLFDKSEVIKASNKFLFDCEVVILPGEGMRFIPKYYSGKFDLHQRAYALKDFNCSGKYVYYYMSANSSLIASKAVQSTVLSLRLPILQKFPIVIPNGKNGIQEQQKIAQCLSVADDLIAAQAQKIEALQEHKKGLLQQLFPKVDS